MIGISFVLMLAGGALYQAIGARRSARAHTRRAARWLPSNSGHWIPFEPRIVVDAIREVVDETRRSHAA